MVTLICLLLAQLPLESEIAFVSRIVGIESSIVLAVASVESGGLSGRDRDVVVSKGNYGTMQVNGTVWRKYVKREWLKNRHVNIMAGTLILAYYKRTFGHERCWVQHYNQGWKTTGDRYCRDVLRVQRRILKGIHKAGW